MQQESSVRSPLATRSPSAPAEFVAGDYAQCLTDIKPRMGNYRLFWPPLRVVRRRMGYLPARCRRLLHRLAPRDRPYFVARTADGTAFVGDVRDTYSVDAAAATHYDSPIIDLLLAHLRLRAGVYVDVGCNMGITAAAV